MAVILLLLGRTLSSKLSDDMKSRTAQCQKSCIDLKQKLGARVIINTSLDVKEIKGEAKVIKDEIDRNSKCRIHDDVHSLRIDHDAFRC